jgi:hypothetical protein
VLGFDLGFSTVIGRYKSAEVVDVEMPGAKVLETKGLDIEELDALVLVSMELGKVPDTMESDAGSEV